MQKSLYEQLKDADRDIRKKRPDFEWTDESKNQLSGKITLNCLLAVLMIVLTFGCGGSTWVQERVDVQTCEHMNTFFKEGVKKYVYGVTSYLDLWYYRKVCVDCGKVLTEYKTEEEYLKARLGALKTTGRSHGNQRHHSEWTCKMGPNLYRHWCCDWSGLRHVCVLSTEGRIDDN